MKAFFYVRSIKTRATLCALLVFLVSLWVLSYFTAQMLQRDIQRMLGEQQFSTATLIAAQINNELTQRVDALELLTTRIDAKLMADPPALQTMLQQRPILARLFNVSVLAVTLDGTGIASMPASPERIGRNYLEIDAIATAINEGRSNIGRPRIGRTSKAPLIPFATPIFGSAGEVIGALTGAIDLSQPNFFDSITEGSYGKTGGFLLAAPQHGLIVTSSVKERIMGELRPAGLYPALDRFADGTEGTAIFIDPLGVEVLGSAKNIPIAGWYLGIRLPTSEAFAPIRDMQRRMTWITLLVTLLAGAIIWWLLRRQLAPLLTTVDTLSQMTTSEQPLKPLPVTHHNEVGELISGFNRLLAILHQREEALKLTHNNMEIAATELQNKNEELEQFVYIVSHDLKSPLVTVKSFLSILEQDIADTNAENIRTDIGYIKGAADKMERLLAALLKLSRVGRLQNAADTTSLNELIDDCLKILAGSIHEQQVEIKVTDAPLNLHGDLLQLGQIWQNLVENAIKHKGEQPQPQIEIGTEEQDGQTVFYVRDNGLGIAPEHHERIFNLFAQLNPAAGGSGLGLALVKKIVELNQGRIWVESDGEGHGSCFYFTLPATLDRQH